MQAPIKGNGADFNPNADYRMWEILKKNVSIKISKLNYFKFLRYHGDRIPGFPQVSCIIIMIYNYQHKLLIAYKL
jgi:hypothetical protein